MLYSFLGLNRVKKKTNRQKMMKEVKNSLVLEKAGVYAQY